MLEMSEQRKPQFSSNLVYMRKRQAADLILSLSSDSHTNTTTKYMLLDALEQLPTECFIATDWYDILKQITTMLLQEERQKAGTPTKLSQMLTSLTLRLNQSQIVTE